MERLTMLTPHGYELNASLTVRGDCEKYNDAIGSLAAYELTGLTPDEIKAMQSELTALRESDRWVPVEESLPESGKHVLLSCKTGSGKTYVCDGYYAAEKTITADDCGECVCGYDDETDEWYLQEGYYEVVKNFDDYDSIAIGDFVTHWRPLPTTPKGD